MSLEENPLFEHDENLPEEEETAADSAVDTALAEHVELSLKKLGMEIAEMKNRLQ